jgi:hypothetical protein
MYSKKWSFWVEKVTFCGQKLTINDQNRLKDLPNIMMKHFLNHCNHLRWVGDVLHLFTAIASTFMVENGQKMGFFEPKMTLFAVQSRPKQSQNRSKMHKTSRNIFFGLIETRFAPLFDINRT